MKSPLIEKDRAFYKAFFRIAIPMGLQQLLLISVNAVDSFMLGSISEVEMSAVAICNQVLFVYTLINYGVCLGGAMVISQYWGQRDKESIKTVMAYVLRYGVIVATTVAALVMLFPEFVMRLYNQDPRVVELGASYLRIAAVSYILYSIGVNMMQCYRSVEKPKIVIISNVITYSLNIGLNYWFIFGGMGLKPMGIQGAALGTVLARALEVLIMVIYARFIEKDLKFRFHDLKRADKAVRNSFFRAAKPVMGHELVWGFGTTMASVIMGQLSTAAIAAYNVAYIVMQIATALCTGISNAAQVVIGTTIGSGQMDKLKIRSHTIMFIAGCQGIFSFFLILLSKDFVLSLYNLEPATEVICGQLIVIFSVISFMVSYETACLVGTLRGGGDARTGFIVDLIVMWCIAIPLASMAAFVWHWDPVFVILCVKLDMPLKSAAGVIKVLRMRWAKNLTHGANA